MEKEKNQGTIINVERTNESLMQEDVVSEQEFKCFNGMGSIYGEKIVKTAQQIAKCWTALQSKKLTEPLIWLDTA